MKIKKTLSLFSLLWILTGCSSIEGLYIHSYEHPTSGYIEEKLIIEKDFSYTYYPSKAEFMIYDTVPGAWKREKNYLILNSDFQDTSKIHIKEMICSNISSDSILFKVYDMVTMDPMEGFLIYYSHNIFDIDETDGKGELILPKIENLNSAYFDISTKYDFVDNSSNVIEIHYRKHPYWFFFNEKFRIGKGKLVLEDNGFEFEYIRW